MATRIETTNAGGYRASDQTNDFQYDAGVIQLPVAARTAAHRLIRLHGGQGQRTATFRFVREGKPPIVPAMQDTSGDTFLGGSICPATPVPSATGRGLDWVVSGTYRFAQDAPRLVGTHAIPVGQNPYLDPSQAAEALAAVPSSVVSAYVASLANGPGTAYQNFIAAVAEATKINGEGDYSWPLLALPTVFSTDHILQD